MKIAFLVPQSLDSPSGLGRFGPLARELAKRGHVVTVFALHYDWPHLSPRRYDDHGVSVIYLGQMHVRKIGSRKLYFDPGRLLMVSLASTIRLAVALWQSDADVIQLCKPQPINALAAQLGSRGRPIFCDCDDYEAATNLFTGEWQRRIVRYFEDKVVSYAQGLTVNTRFTFNRYVALGYPAQRVIYVPNGVERNRFEKLFADPAATRRRWGFEESTPVIVYVGTMSILSHAVDLLLEAFAMVLRQRPETKLLLVGGGEDFDILAAMTDKLGVSQQTIFAGRQPPEEIPAILSLATVSVDPVRDDAIAAARSPLKVIESLAVGIPVVTGDVGDRREMLADGAMGVLVRPGDSTALAEGLLAVLDDPIRRAQMALAARAGREHWYWDRLAENFVRVYDLAGLR